MSSSRLVAQAGKGAIHWRPVMVAALLVCLFLGGLIARVANHGKRPSGNALSNKLIAVPSTEPFPREEPRHNPEVSLVFLDEGKGGGVHPALDFEMVPPDRDAKQEKHKTTIAIAPAIQPPAAAAPPPGKKLIFKRRTRLTEADLRRQLARTQEMAPQYVMQYTLVRMYPAPQNAQPAKQNAQLAKQNAQPGAQNPVPQEQVVALPKTQPAPQNLQPVPKTLPAPLPEKPLAIPIAPPAPPVLAPPVARAVPPAPVLAPLIAPPALPPFKPTVDEMALRMISVYEPNRCSLVHYSINKLLSPSYTVYWDNLMDGPLPDKKEWMKRTTQEIASNKPLQEILLRDWNKTSEQLLVQTERQSRMEELDYYVRNNQMDNYKYFSSEYGLESGLAPKSQPTSTAVPSQPAPRLAVTPSQPTSTPIPSQPAPTVAVTPSQPTSTVTVPKSNPAVPSLAVPLPKSVPSLPTVAVPMPKPKPIPMAAVPKSIPSLPVPNVTVVPPSVPFSSSFPNVAMMQASLMRQAFLMRQQFMSLQLQAMLANNESLQQNTQPNYSGPLPMNRPYDNNAPRRKAVLTVAQLARIKGPKASAALAELALYDLSVEVRESAVQALADRPRDEYRRVLLGGFRYPWAAVADHAAEALVALEDRDSIPALVKLLQEPDPKAPRQGENKKETVVSELVRVHHRANCIACHSPANPDDKVANPAQPMLQVSLRQDFSVPQTVGKKGTGGVEQPYDYVIRIRPSTRAELNTQQKTAKLEPQYEQREAVLFALRELTGEDVGSSSKSWQEYLEEKAEKPSP